jgi:protein-tyrosine-phosphatase
MNGASSNNPVRTLFVCIGNSCRSPMAEALARHLGADVIEPSSAGIYPASIIQPETLQVLEERGIKLEPRKPRSLFLLDAKQVDLLVNMSGAPLDNLLHSFLGRQIVWPVRDPVGQPLGVYRAVRDEIEKKVSELIKELRQSG